MSKWLRQHVFELATVILAVAAIVFAAIQFGDSRRQLNRSAEQLKTLTGITFSLGTVTSSLGTITSAIQTHYVGQFPANLDGVLDVIRQSPEGAELDLMVDFAAYAVYSRNTTYQQYVDALINSRQKKNVLVRMLAYDKQLAEVAARTQFTQSDFEAERSKNFRGFFDEYPPMPTTYDKFIARMMELNEEAAHRMCENRIEIRRVPASQKYVFFLWANNTPQAVFTFRNEVARTENRELSFKSLDPSLIEVFRIIFDQTWKNVIPTGNEDPACTATRLQQPKASGPARRSTGRAPSRDGAPRN